MDQADIPALLSRLASDEDAARKMAVFKLQSSINDPAFADVFISSGGLVILRRLIMTTGGNTLAYSLQSLSRLLEVDMGWDIFEGAGAGELVERVVELVVTNPLVNILRGAMSILVGVVGHQPGQGQKGGVVPGTFGFRALKPAVAVYPQFFELVIQQLHSADHALCANALGLINALVRDAVVNDVASGTVATGGAKGGTAAGGGGGGEDWSKFIKRLQDLGLIKAVYNLLQSSSLQDLAHPLLEFQGLTKVLLRKWREVRVDLERPEHRRALKGLHLASAPDRRHVNGVAGGVVVPIPPQQEEGTATTTTTTRKTSRKHNPEKWRRLGFETESPAAEFETAGFLGMMDLTDYVRKNEDGFQKLLLEQSTHPLNERCPVARASLAVTMILYDHFEVDKSDLEDIRGYLALNDGKNNDRLFKPLLLQWSRLHTAGLHAFFRMWKATGAQREDFDKVAELVRILIEQVVGQASRTKDVLEVEDELQEYDAGRLRELQMELLELSFEDTMGHASLPGPRGAQTRGAVVCQGAAYPVSAAGLVVYQAHVPQQQRPLERKQLPEEKALSTLAALTEKIDLSTISSVVSNVSAPNETEPVADPDAADSPAANSTASRHGAQVHKPTTKITIYSFVEDIPGGSKPESVAGNSTSAVAATSNGEPKEQPILTLFPLNHSLASEWLDGLLMLLNQTPITAETNKLVTLVSEYGLKIRLLNVRLEQMYAGPVPGAGVVPSREGLDEDYFYEI
ncbi:uncharacterized protein PODANS_1_2910 [Podospora anserina S mat+]|uniref:Podospora anserina S mat+ genomic DNA chromosome 1, supercontig 1 n=1 Tax=Podospora anserina (strain S / ATCC MYA-4624 / DSM 980 / FGSC 10383) TaxID=515849 RepID=B2AA56_PODAN|nr:uncharacterized protein PODANS_1_2910 [Podospora anserina S mat+]CAP59967.1 unnamed protein product [Podospora anserina S mat+]